MPREQSSLKERINSDIKEPRHYAVVFHNDDFTPMDFVVKMLTEVFFKSPEEAEILMMKVHVEGKAIIGIYSLDIAASKAQKTTSIARKEGFPLRLTVEPA